MIGIATALSLRASRGSDIPFVRLLVGVGDERDITIKRATLEFLGRWTLALTAAGIARIVASLPAR